MIKYKGFVLRKLNTRIASLVIKNNFRKELTFLSKHAFRSIKSARLNKEKIPDRSNIRSSFFHDIDRIIHSQCYSRYIDKTQVFYLIENDHITHRVLHVQFVSKIGRVIGRSLQLNEDLIEAIALGHDVGHAPYGHNGEKYLNAFCEENKVGHFVHNAQSVRLLSELEDKGEGFNLTLQVLDGILCHNGEILDNEYYPKYGKTFNEHLLEYKKCFNEKNYDRKLLPTTLEGCVMRISDVIAYSGRDVEDAITLSLIHRKDIPIEVRNILGDTNNSIINNLVIDLINNSYGKDHLAFSKKVYKAFTTLKQFNNDRIYNNPKKQAQDSKVEYMFKLVFDKYLEALKNDNENFFIVKWAKNKVGKNYLANNALPRIVVDYIAGMTDDFINKEYHNLVVPKSFGYKF